MRKRSTFTVGAIIAASLVVYGSPLSATADVDPDPIDELTEVVEAELPTSEDGLEAVLSGGEFEQSASDQLDLLIKDGLELVDGYAFGDGSMTTLPATDDATAETVNLVTGEELTIAVPAATSAELTGDVSSLTGDDGTSTIVQATVAGVQVVTTVTEPSAALALDLVTTVPEGTTWTVQPDGAVVLAGETGVASAIVGAPWAIDASGRSLDTHFTVEGDVLTQHVDTADAVFPVVADPDLWWYIGTSAVCIAEVASLAVVGAKALAAFVKADRIIKSVKSLTSAYKTLGGTVAKFVDLLKKYVKKKTSLTKKQITALENLIKGVGSLIFNLIGLGSCYSLFTER